jgi:hypothetical protein
MQLNALLKRFKKIAIEFAMGKIFPRVMAKMMR